MLSLLTILLYFSIALVIFLMVLLFWGVQRFFHNKKQGALPARFRRALKFLKQEGSVMVEEYEDYMGVSEDQALKDLKTLEKMGLVKAVESQGKSYYRSNPHVVEV